MRPSSEASVVIGWTEYVDLPEWNVFGLRAKVDTGARSSALHVSNLELLENGEVGFDVVRRRNGSARPRTRVVAPVARRGAVRSSSGHASPRIFVETVLRLGGVEKRIEIGLVDRGPMIHRMLLGRNALAGPFLIDVARRLALGERERRARRRRRAPARAQPESKESHESQRSQESQPSRASRQPQSESQQSRASRQPQSQEPRAQQEWREKSR